MNRLRRLDDLLELFGSSSNVETPVDTNSFGRKAGELISRGATAQMPGQTQPMSWTRANAMACPLLVKQTCDC
jgi:hypothetical protein